MNKTPSEVAAATVPARVERIELDPAAYDRVVSVVSGVAEETVATIMAEVPTYAGPFSGDLGERIREAVQFALVGFLDLTRAGGDTDPSVPIAPSTAAAYELGKGEARSGRSMDALLAAYRVGARVAWRGLSREAVAAGVSSGVISAFAELVFAYIDALSAASIAGHSDELAMLGRVRERQLEALTRHLLAGEDPTTLTAAAERADWSPPRTLTAVLLPEGQAGAVLGLLDARTLLATGELPGVAQAGISVLLVPDVRGSDRRRLVELLEGRAAVIGPARPWLQTRSSFERAARARSLPRPARRAAIDTEERLVELILRADPEALTDLRTQVLAPLDGVRPAARVRLTETLRSWLLHHGRRELIAEHLFVHPQTVRYRMTQLREVFGERLDDPDEVLRLTVALAMLPAADTLS
ncbi:MAG: PucR family transcriptional regulator [Dermatophilaceae bacterium]